MLGGQRTGGWGGDTSVSGRVIAHCRHHDVGTATDVTVTVTAAIDHVDITADQLDMGLAGATGVIALGRFRQTVESHVCRMVSSEHAVTAAEHIVYLICT